MRNPRASLFKSGAPPTLARLVLFDPLALDRASCRANEPFAYVPHRGARFLLSERTTLSQQAHRTARTPLDPPLDLSLVVRPLPHDVTFRGSRRDWDLWFRGAIGRVANMRAALLRGSVAIGTDKHKAAQAID